MYQKVIKRLFDFLLAVLALAVLALPMCIVVVLIRADSSGKALFAQKRIGQNKICFNILKFRSMPQDAPADLPTHELKKTALELTDFQRLIRRLSIDELPQFVNILKGDMSLIGPRPALPNQTALLALRDAYGANSVKPGLTGWAQINGRDDLDDEQKARLDGEYVKALNRGFISGMKMDLKCFFGTIRALLKPEHIEEFK